MSITSSVLPPSPPVRADSYRERLDRDAILAAIVAVVWVHLLVIWLTPRQAYMPEPVMMPPPQTVALELVPPPIELEDDPNYLRANPEANNEVPLDTTDYSTQDQVAAQEEASLLDDLNVPAQEGDRENSNRLVQGDPNQPPPMPTAQPSQQTQDEAPPPQEAAPNTPLALTRPDLFDAEPEVDEGMAVLPEPEDNIEMPEDLQDVAELNPVERPSPLDGPGEAQEFTPPRPMAQPAPQVQPPRARPSLPDNSHGPTMDRLMGVARTGRVAFNARYTEFGVYWNRVLEIIELRWNSLVRNNLRSITFNNSSITIQFVLTRQGQIRDVRVVRTEVGRLPEALALDSIQSPAPFDEWTPEMIARMGTETVEEITFIY